MRLTTTTDPITSLRVVLATNAATSALTGVTALVAGDSVDRLLGTGHPGWVRLVGVGLVVFALGVVALSRSDHCSVRRLAPAVSVADTCWVVASVATIAGGWYSGRGVAVIGAVAVIVGTFAVTQLRLWVSGPFGAGAVRGMPR